jgi:hypothetical protein
MQELSRCTPCQFREIILALLLQLYFNRYTFFFLFVDFPMLPIFLQLVCAAAASGGSPIPYADGPIHTGPPIFSETFVVHTTEIDDTNNGSVSVKQASPTAVGLCDWDERKSGHVKSDVEAPVISWVTCLLWFICQRCHDYPTIVFDDMFFLCGQLSLCDVIGAGRWPGSKQTIAVDTINRRSAMVADGEMVQGPVVYTFLGSRLCVCWQWQCSLGHRGGFSSPSTVLKLTIVNKQWLWNAQALGRAAAVRHPPHGLRARYARG